MPNVGKYFALNMDTHFSWQDKNVNNFEETKSLNAVKNLPTL